MKKETPYSFYDYQVSPDYTEFKDYSNFNTPQNFSKNETSEMILSQTKASLNNFLSNLKKGTPTTTTNNALIDTKNKSKPTKVIANNISHLPINKFKENMNIYNTENRSNNIYNYKKINNNTFNTINNNNSNNNMYSKFNNKTLSQNNTQRNNYKNTRNQIRIYKQLDNEQFYEKNKTDFLENKKLNNFLNNYSNGSDDNANNFIQYSTAQRAKNSDSNIYQNSRTKSEDKKDIIDAKVVKSLTTNLRKLKIENIKNKSDVFTLKQIYNEMQNILLQEISRYSKLPRDINAKQLIDLQKELSDYENKYKILAESNKKSIEEKDARIKELSTQSSQLKEKNKNLEIKIKELTEENKSFKLRLAENNSIMEKNKKLLSDIDNFKKEIKKLTKENQELNNTMLVKDITIEKYNEKIKDLEEKLKEINDKEIINKELKEKENEISNNNSKYNQYELLLLEYKKKNDELINKNEEIMKENKSIKGQFNIMKSQKKYLTTEGNNNKQLIEDLKINNEQLIKERDDYKIKNQKLINEIEIIKLNNDRITNIKANVINNTDKLKNEINLLKKEKEFLGQKNDELQKRITSMDKRSLRNKSTPGKSTAENTSINSINNSSSKAKKFLNLSIFKNKDSNFVLNNKSSGNNAKNDSNKNNNRSISKNKPKKVPKKPHKFTKLSISNKTVDVCITKSRSLSVNKKAKKPVNKFKRLIYASKIVDLCIKSTPKPAPKPKKKKFLKLKIASDIAKLTIKSKINKKKFNAKKLKPSSINKFKIEPTGNKNKKKKDIALSKTKTEFIYIGKSIKKQSIEIALNKTKTEFFYIEKSINKKIDIANNSGDKKTNNANINIYQIKKGENIIFEGKEKAKPIISFNVYKNESFILSCNPKVKSEKSNVFNIFKNESFCFNKINSNSKQEEIKNINTNINNNIYNIEKIYSYELDLNIKPKGQKVQYQITNITPINFEGKNKLFQTINCFRNVSFYLFNEKKDDKSQNKNKCEYSIEKNQNIEFASCPKKKNIEYQMLKNSSIFYTGKKRLFSNINSFKNASIYYRGKIPEKFFKELRFNKVEVFEIEKPKKKTLFNIKNIFKSVNTNSSSNTNTNTNNNINIFSKSSKTLTKYDAEEKARKLLLKINKNNTVTYKGTKPKKEFNKGYIKKVNNSQIFYEPSKKKLLLNITQNDQININSKPKPILSIGNSSLFSLISVEDTSNLVEGEENLKKMIKELNKKIASKDEEIKKVEEEKKDMEEMRKLFADESNRQIDNLNNTIKEMKGKNEELTKENESLKQDIDKKEESLDILKKEFEENKNNMNKTIEELTKETRQFKLEIFKKNNEIEELKSNMNNNTGSKADEKKPESNSSNNNTQVGNNASSISPESKSEIEALKTEINKLKQSKIIETSQLKLEMTKYKVKLKSLTNEIEKLKQEKNDQNNKKEDNLDTLKINDVVKDNSNNTEEINELKNKNQLYQEQIIKMEKEIEEYKSKGGVASGVNAKEFEELKKKNELLLSKIQEAQKKIVQANSLINKAKKFNICMSFVTQLLPLFTPSNEKQTYLFNKLKGFADEYEKEKTAKKHE